MLARRGTTACKLSQQEEHQSVRSQTCQHGLCWWQGHISHNELKGERRACHRKWLCSELNSLECSEPSRDPGRLPRWSARRLPPQTGPATPGHVILHTAEGQTREGGQVSMLRGSIKVQLSLLGTVTGRLLGSNGPAVTASCLELRLTAGTSWLAGMCAWQNKSATWSLARMKRLLHFLRFWSNALEPAEERRGMMACHALAKVSNLEVLSSCSYGVRLG